MNTHRLTINHFLTAITVSSLAHALAFSMVTALFLAIVFGGGYLGLMFVPAICAIYISSYACHELGHYYTALYFRAQPVLWIDYISVSVLSNPLQPRHGQFIAVAGPAMAVIWISAWWGVISFFLPALRFAALIPGGLLVSAHLGSLLPVFSDGKALTQYLGKRRMNKRSYV